MPTNSGPSLSTISAVALGGALGSLARWGLTELPITDWVVILAINIVGCLSLGALSQTLPRRPWLGPFLGAGVLGGFTTMSTFAVQTVTLAEAGQPATAASYWLLSAAGCWAAAVAGLRIGQRIASNGASS